MFGVAVFLQGLGSMMQFFHPGASLGISAFTDAFLFCAFCLVVTAVFSALHGKPCGRQAALIENISNVVSAVDKSLNPSDPVVPQIR